MLNPELFKCKFECRFTFFDSHIFIERIVLRFDNVPIFYCVDFIDSLSSTLATPIRQTVQYHIE